MRFRIKANKKTLPLWIALVATFITGDALYRVAVADDITLSPNIFEGSLDAVNTSDNSSTQTGPLDGTVSAVLPSGETSVTSPDGTSTASISASGFPNPSLTVSSSGNASGGFQLEYFFEANGPANIQVPISLSGTATVDDVIAASVAVVSLDLPSGAVQFGVCYAPQNGTFCHELGGNSPGSSPFDLSTTITSDTAYAVTLLLGAGEALPDGQAAAAASSFASIDPILTIDPIFADIGEFTLDVSPGIGNSPTAASVPEPASFALMGLGLTGLIVVRSRRKK